MNDKGQYYQFEDLLQEQYEIIDKLVPVNPNQILMAIKKILDSKRLISESNTLSYQQNFREISNDLNNSMNLGEWIELFKKLNFWELQLEMAAVGTPQAMFNSVLHSLNHRYNTTKK